MNKIVGIISSWLDNDCYNFHQSYFFWKKWRNAVGVYAYKCRSKGKDLTKLSDALADQLLHLSNLAFTEEDARILKKNSKCSSAFCKALVGQQILNFCDITMKWASNGDIILRYKGPIWLRILVETPLLATISELYFKHTMTEEAYSDAHYAGAQWAKSMVQKLFDTPEGFTVAEGGTRRRFSVQHYDVIMNHLVLAYKAGKISGTSNVLFGEKYGIPVMGTMAHQLQMFYQAVTSLQYSVKAALVDWIEVFGEEGQAMGTALTDTLGDRVWGWTFDDPELQAFFHTERHDSNDPFAWGVQRLRYFQKRGIPTKDRSFLFSDSLDIDKAVALFNAFKNEIGVKLMIGTYLTNTIPVEGHEALSQVIKLMWVDFGDGMLHPLVKLSSDAAKNQGECEAHTQHAVWVADNCPDVFEEAA